MPYYYNLNVNGFGCRKKLSEEDMELVKEACRMAVELEEMKQRILAYVQSRMSFIAPNLTVIVGASTAAKLMGKIVASLAVKLAKADSTAATQSMIIITINTALGNYSMKQNFL